MQNSGFAVNVNGDFMSLHLKLVTKHSLLLQAAKLSDFLSIITLFWK